MIGVVEKLQKIGLTEYEAKAYMGLLNVHLSTATQLSEKSGVPRTKIARAHFHSAASAALSGPNQRLIRNH